MKGIKKKISKTLLSFMMVFVLTLTIIPTNVLAIENAITLSESNIIMAPTDTAKSISINAPSSGANNSYWCSASGDTNAFTASKNFLNTTESNPVKLRGNLTVSFSPAKDLLAGDYNLTVIIYGMNRTTNSVYESATLTLHMTVAAKQLVTVYGGSGSGFYAENDTVTIVADAPEDGKKFKGWDDAFDNVTLADPTSMTTTFTMPSSEVILMATYERAEAKLTGFTFPNKGDAISVPSISATNYSELLIDFDYFKIDEVYITDAESNKLTTGVYESGKKYRLVIEVNINPDKVPHLVGFPATIGNETAYFSYDASINAGIVKFEFTIPLTDKDKVDKAKPLAETSVADITATNNTIAESILDAVTTGISSVDEVIASWKTGSPTITTATKDNVGSITGTIVLTSGSETTDVTVNIVINKIPKTDKDKLYEAKPLAQTAITGITATNDTTAGNILDAVTTGISSVDGITVSWKTGSPTITLATKDNAGSITGSIVLTSGSETVDVTVNKLIERIPAPTPDKPTISVGNNGAIHQMSSGKDMTFTCSGKLEDLTGVYVDGKLVDESNYTLKSSYLDTLSAGKHTLKFQYKDNVSAETNFTITAKTGETPAKPSSPKTGDNSSAMLYLGLIVLSGCVAGLGLKKKKHLN